MSKVIKAGCIMINPTNKTVALVYREKQNDFSFPKGHIEPGETIEECALRETAEETKRECILLKKEFIYIEEYVTPGGEDVRMYYFLGKDGGPSNNDSPDTHPTIWVPFDKVYDKLSYSGLRDVWESIKNEVELYLK